MLVRCPRVIGWSFHLPLTSRQPAAIHHMTGWWVWPWLCVICAWQWKWHQWMPFDCFQCWCSLCPPLCGSTLIRVLVALATPVKIFLKWWAIQLYSYIPFNSWCICRPWIAVARSWWIECKHPFPSCDTLLQIIKIGISNCVYKLALKSSHAHTHTPHTHTHARTHTYIIGCLSLIFIIAIEYNSSIPHKTTDSKAMAQELLKAAWGTA